MSKNFFHQLLNTGKRTFLNPVLCLFLIGLTSFALLQKDKPTVYLIGDSTVRNTNPPQVGWGNVIDSLFDTTRIRVANHAMAGRSSRSFTNEGRWARVDSLLKPGDYVLMQFGHNDGSYPDTTAKNRGTLKGNGEDTVLLQWRDGRRETVHSHGWYIRQFVRAAKAKGATPIVLSMIPRNVFKDGKVVRATDNFTRWDREVAEQEGALFIDLNDITADKYEGWGPEKVKTFFPGDDKGDHTHTNHAGAAINAASVVEGIKSLSGCDLKKYVKK
ncbi:rhamnogalacturonan acetylesterase [Paraflavisolibacter sp. H34]|uniref:rhamnogalacturonan acetylesterase n=1 Tax=Huijunlia imazamoxiresistens TaxID=3127457 RepID=UPI00301B01A8